MRKLFAVRDSKSEAYMSPFCCGTHGEAERSFSDACGNVEDRGNMIAMHPEDYTLFFVGEWDHERGIVVPNKEGPVVVGNGLQFVRKEG